MKVLVAMDSFKGTFSSLEVADIIEKGIRKVYRSAGMTKISIADGGEGTVDALVESMNGEYVFAEVTDPVGNKVNARYGLINGDTAVIEMSQASGLCLVPEGKRNPFIASTYGTGELIINALDKGCKKIIIGIGGSATNDGGAGMAAALGAKLTDKYGKDIKAGGGGLGELEKIDITNIDKRIKDTGFIIACDVDNPLCGENGASKVFGPQKGATDEMTEILDKNLLRYAQVIKKDLSKDIKNIPGAGAAGGMGAGLIAFCNAKITAGIDTVLDTLNIDEKIRNADIIITGEGRIDGQTVHGKVPVGIAARAKKYNKPVFAIAGFIDSGAELVYDHGIDSIVSSIVAPMNLQQVIGESPVLLQNAAERLFRVIKAVNVEL